MRIVLDVVLGVLVATMVGLVGDRLNNGKNREAQAAERGARAQERMADALDRRCPDLERPSMYQEPDR